MPHIRLEYSANVGGVADLHQLFEQIHCILAETAGIRRGNCKSRAIPVESWHVGSGTADSAFVHADVRFLEGRSSNTKRAVGRQILSALKDHFHPPPDVDDFQLTVEVRDILKDSYFKFPDGTLPPESHA